jgi:hypothetical protein
MLIREITLDPTLPLFFVNGVPAISLPRFASSFKLHAFGSCDVRSCNSMQFRIP